MDSDLIDAAQTVSQTVEFASVFGVDTTVADLPTNDDESEHEQTPGSGISFPMAMYASDGRILYSGLSGELAEHALAAASVGVTEALTRGRDLRSVGPGDESARVMSLPVVTSNQTVGVVQIFASEKGLHDLLSALRIGILGVSIGGIIVAVVGGYFLSNQALTPVRSAFRNQQQFISNASHQLRTPVAVIRADAELLERSLEDLSDDDRQILQDLVHESDFLSRIVQQLLVVARLQETADITNRELIDVSEMVRESVEAISSVAESQKVHVEVGEMISSAMVSGDPPQLRFALMGLLDNAVKYNRTDGSVTVTTSINGRWVESTITDTGQGVPLDEQERVFERFHRGANARDRKIEGSGLGLPVARQVARSLGGDVTLHSRIGESTTVTLRLPLA
jgi:signal transduction histidine kinase